MAVDADPVAAALAEAGSGEALSRARRPCRVPVYTPRLAAAAWAPNAVVNPAATRAAWCGRPPEDRPGRAGLRGAAVACLPRRGRRAGTPTRGAWLFFRAARGVTAGQW